MKNELFHEIRCLFLKPLFYTSYDLLAFLCSRVPLDDARCKNFKNLGIYQNNNFENSLRRLQLVFALNLILNEIATFIMCSFLSIAFSKHIVGFRLHLPTYHCQTVLLWYILHILCITINNCHRRNYMGTKRGQIFDNP